MSQESFPRVFRLRQNLPRRAPVNIPSAVEAQLSELTAAVKPGAKIAIGVGSRGIANLAAIVARAVERLQGAGAKPFIIPAMGSHGGATPEGQTRILADYGVTPETVGAPIEPAMETRRLGSLSTGSEVVLSSVALDADGILVVNRVKPHTDFTGSLGSGLMKMLVVGLGKHAGAARFHRAAQSLGYEAALRETARVILSSAPVLGGLALIEDGFHQTARISALQPGDFERGEEQLLLEARELMPGLPFDEVDLLIVDRIGKNISGTGMDSNVIGRSVHGYSTLFSEQAGGSPRVKRIFVRGLTPETHGNSIGVGMADLTTTRLIEETDREITAVNALTSMTPNSAKLPIAFDSDREAIAAALTSLALENTAQCRIIRIRDTLDLQSVVVSEAYLETAGQRSDLIPESAPLPMEFDAKGDLRDL